MNKKLKLILLMIASLITLLLITSCGEDSHYAELDEKGSSISVKYDANGGEFTTGVSTIVDTYSLNSLPTKDGKKIAKLITPNDEIRGSGNSFTPTKAGHIFVGWYATREDAQSGEGYVYGNKWDFENDRLELDPGKEYTAEAPVITLYAAWIPKFTVEVYSKENPEELLGSFKIDINEAIKLPSWDKSSGKIKMESFPTIDGRTFEALYLSPTSSEAVSGKTINHIANVNYENATVDNTVMKFYMETIEGDWRHIFTTEQLKNISLNGNYIIENDIDLNFKYSNWGSHLVSGKFTGTLVGKTQENGEPVKLKNINFEQATMGGSTFATGLFGQIGDGATIKNIAFENVTMEITKGAPLTSNVNMGLLAGIISDNASIENVSISGVIKIDSACKFQGGYTIGVLCAIGNSHGVDSSNVTCEVTGKNPDSITATIVDGMVELVFVQAE